MWDNLAPIDGPCHPMVDAAHWARLQDVAAQVRGRTYAKAWLDKHAMEICFGYEHADGYIPGFACAFPVFRRTGAPMTFDAALDSFGPDQIVFALQLGKASPRDKARWMLQREVEVASERKRGIQQAHDDRRHELERQIDREYVRMSMGRHYRGRAMVNGFRKPVVAGAR